MRFRLVLIVLGLLLVFGTAGVPQAGIGNPNWFNEPVEGPSPNATHQVGNSLGGECVGINDSPAVVTIELRQPDETPFDPQILQQYETDETGNWSGDFPIPAGLAPGVYPLHGDCNPFGSTSIASGGMVGQVLVLGGGGFSYADRSYTVVADRDPAEPVEAEVTLTG